MAKDWFIYASDATYYDNLQNNSPSISIGPNGPWSVLSSGQEMRGRIFAHPGHRKNSGRGEGVISIWPLPTTPLALLIRDVARSAGGGTQVLDEMVSEPGFASLISSFSHLKSGEWHGDMAHTIDLISQDLTGVGSHRSCPDERARLLAKRLRQRDLQPLPLLEHAKAIGLSAERLRHLFAEAYGLRVTQYIAWLKLHAAIRFMAMSKDIPTVANVAAASGFADAAHLSNMARRMFATSPSETQASSFQFVLVKEPNEAATDASNDLQLA